MSTFFNPQTEKNLKNKQDKQGQQKIPDNDLHAQRKNPQIIQSSEPSHRFRFFELNPPQA
jgi:hypothetical protein